MGWSFSYPVTRAFTIRYFTVTFLCLALLWLVAITIINLIVVGYENVPLIGDFSSFNNSPAVWYQKLIPTTYALQKSRTCNGSVIPLNSSGSLLRAKLMF